jgi:hypothetical protein
MIVAPACLPLGEGPSASGSTCRATPLTHPGCWPLTVTVIAGLSAPTVAVSLQAMARVGQRVPIRMCRGGSRPNPTVAGS